MKNFLIRMGVLALSLIALNAGPVYQHMSKGIKTTPLEVRIPFTEEKSNEEFLITFIIQCTLGVYGFVGYFSMEVGMELMFGVVNITPILIKHEFRKLDEKIKNNLFNRIQASVIFKNIVQQMMDVDE